MRIHDADLAAVSPCPGCGVSVRRFPSVPVRGAGLDGEPSGPWRCPSCLAAKCTSAVAGITSPLPDLDRFDEAPTPTDTGALR